jgi:glycosyltransferase involved in cell wall biosynthesis
MKVLFALRPGKELAGGDVVQAHKTAEALRQLGVEADVEPTDNPAAYKYDIVHIITVWEPDVCARQMDVCETQGVPVALTPAWYSTAEKVARAPKIASALTQNRRAEAIERELARIRDAPLGKLLGRGDRAGLEKLELAQTRLIRRAAVLLPLSAWEAREIQCRLGVRELPFAVVPNAVDPMEDAPPVSARRGIVCAARIELHKNQAMLAFALRDDPVEITFVGGVLERFYLDVLRRWAGPRVTIAGQIPQDQLFELLRRCAVHAMPSWGEGGALANLEAAAAGARLVLSDRTGEIECFGGDADYADPSDAGSIRAAVLRALDRPARQRDDHLSRRIRERYSWLRVAQDTLYAYSLALQRQHRDATQVAGVPG